jgi:phenylacetate-CoA ligase
MRNKNNFTLLKAWLKDTSFFADSIVSDENLLQKEGQKKALALFHNAANNVPAYKDFLTQQKIVHTNIKTIKDFANVPETTKENYIERYNMRSRCWNGTTTSMNIISTSSGTTGTPHFWPRNLQTEIEGASAHEFILKSLFQIDKKKTLLINGFAMGTWIAGTFTLACTTLLTWKGYQVTTMTPGYSLDPIIEILTTIASDFEQVIIAGHIPFLKEILETAKKRGISLKDIKLLGTGQGITENWRSYMNMLLSFTEESSPIINLYGSADAALMGFETQTSIEIRRLLTNSPKTSATLFNDERLPSLYNYDPRLIYFETNKNELLITKNGGCPLIKYNIHDQGGIYEYDTLKQYIEKSFDTHIKGQYAKFPFVYLFGREKFMVKIYGANVYSEHVQHALNHSKLQEFITGRFLLESDFDNEQNPLMICRVELNNQIKESPELIRKIEEIFIDEVRKLNSEYNDALTRLGDKLKPVILAYENGHEIYFPKGKVKKTN